MPPANTPDQERKLAVNHPCPCCGIDATEFQEGYCLSCFTDRQNVLDFHNAEFDRWQSMSDRQREDAIRSAIHG